MKNKIIAIILCAGEGIRLKEITKNIPKPLIKIKELNNISILEHTISSLIELGIHRIAIVKGHLGMKIDECVSSIKNYNSNFEEKLIIIDSGNQYKLGPLYSFLTITTSKNVFKRNSIYIVIPGDTIFQFNLLNQIFSIIVNNFNLIQKYPLIFYREMIISALKEQQESKTISIADIEKKDSKCFIRQIKKYKLQDFSDSDFIKQIIPVFIFSFDFIKRIKKFENKFSVNTIREIINHMIRNGSEIIAMEIEKKINFHDIDYETDLNIFNNLLKRRKKEDNRSSDNLKNYCFEGI
ncbi:MAG: sugar phosphate nucleotidyltransferase [Candidatus Hodarchaeota archaeon]